MKEHQLATDLTVTNPLPEYCKANHEHYIDLTRSKLHNYNREAIRQFGYLDNQGLALDDDDNKNGPIYIDRLYVLPKASRTRIAPEQLSQLEMQGKAEKTPELENIANLIWRNPRLTLLGDPGVGKTTLTQWLICSLCHPSENYAQEQIGRLFPLILTARKIPSTMAATPLDNSSFINAIFATQVEKLGSLLLNNEGAQQTLTELLNLGQVLFIVDSLDEMAPATARWLNKQIRQLLTEYPKIRLLLTSRVVGFSADIFWQIFTSETFDKEKAAIQQDKTIQFQRYIDVVDNQANLPTTYYLAPFIPAQRKLFASNWMKNYLPPNQAQRDAFLAGINDVSKHSLQLNALSRIPVLLNLICFILWRRGQLPNGRAELYLLITQTYLVTMDRVRSISKEISDEYDYQDIKNWLGKLALQMHAGKLMLAKNNLASYDEETLEDLRLEPPEKIGERQLQITEDELNQFLQLQLSEAVGANDLQRHSEQLIHYIKTRTGFLIPKGQIDGEECYGFSHLSFQEYFAAYAISKRLLRLNPNDKATKALFATTEDPAWSEIWQLVLEELSLSGATRREIEEQLERVFPDPTRDSYFEGFAECVPEQVELYCKIIVNPAIKIASVKRHARQLSLVISYLQNDLLSNVLDKLANHLLRNPAPVINALSTIEYLALFEKDITEFAWIGQLTQLKTLNLFSTNIVDLSPLLALKKLQTLLINRGLDKTILDTLRHRGVEVDEA